MGAKKQKPEAARKTVQKQRKEQKKKQTQKRQKQQRRHRSGDGSDAADSDKESEEEEESGSVSAREEDEESSEAAAAAGGARSRAHKHKLAQLRARPYDFARLLRSLQETLNSRARTVPDTASNGNGTPADVRSLIIIFCFFLFFPLIAPAPLSLFIPFPSLAFFSFLLPITQLRSLVPPFSFISLLCRSLTALQKLQQKLQQIRARPTVFLRRNLVRGMDYYQKRYVLSLTSLPFSFLSPLPLTFSPRRSFSSFPFPSLPLHALY